MLFSAISRKAAGTSIFGISNFGISKDGISNEGAADFDVFAFEAVDASAMGFIQKGGFPTRSERFALSSSSGAVVSPSSVDQILPWGSTLSAVTRLITFSYIAC
jgi:hypothetical protein